jgi:hypothetical protein
VTPVNQEFMGLLLKRGNQRVLEDTIITPEDTLRGGHIVVQAHLLPESIGDLEWMN